MVMRFWLVMLPSISLATVISAALTGWVRRYALKSNLLDIPNDRSSHEIPTPRGGGVAMAVVFCGGLGILGLSGLVDARIVWAMLPAAALVAIVGFVDDRRGMSPLARLSAHTLSAGYFLAVTGGSPVLGIAWLDAIPALAFLMALLGLVWLLNAFNFMDGIDGLAASEAAVVSAGLALVAGISGGAAATEVCAVLLVASSAGFLWWNWPPARIFMGDVGSGFLGVTLGMLALLAVREAKVPVWVPVILGGSFMVDASVTLLRRVARGGKWYLPHRTHAYQWLSRRWGAHLPVVILVLAINVAWLLPLALIAQQRPNMAGVLTLVAYVPLVGLALKAGSGRAEDREH